ncbi:MAG: hypothetical protein IPM29_28515 [Planctomycetes bacterium]|nr:hypothetical protein [Planctomycetota bacterium]
MDSLPSGIRKFVARLEREPLRSVAELRAELGAFERGLDSADAHHPLADLALARRIASGCRRLLADPRNTDPARLRRVQLAVRYLVLEDDAESDRRSPLGFDDDAQVFDIVATELGSPELRCNPQDPW